VTAAIAHRAFRVFHAVLGLGLLILSLQAIAHAMHELHGLHGHYALVGELEAIGATLFLIPRTLRVGAVLLLVVILGVLIVHAFRHEPRIDLVIYAAGVWMVMANADSA
jgi:hypothetical protein